MNRATVALILLVAAVVAGCGQTRSGTTRPQRRGIEAPRPQPAATPAASVVVEVFGTSGTRFGGVYGELTDPKTIEGTVPAQLRLSTGSGFRIALQKRGTDGELGMTVTVNGRQVSRSTTTREYGVVTFTQRPTASR